MVELGIQPSMPVLSGCAASPMPKWVGNPFGTGVARTVRALHGLARLLSAAARSMAEVSKTVCIDVLRIVPVPPLLLSPHSSQCCLCYLRCNDDKAQSGC